MAFTMLVGCGDAREKEGEKVADLVKQIEAEPRPDQRVGLIARLRSVAASHRDARAARDQCVRAHRSLIDAEHASKKADAWLGRAEEAPSESGQRDEAIRQVREAVAVARELFDKAEHGLVACHRRLRVLGGDGEGQG